MSSDAPRDDDPETPDSAESLRVIKSDDLLRGQREVLIEHEGELYRLRLTSRGRLYLSK